VLLVRRSRLFAGNVVPVGRVLGVQGYDKGFAERGDAAGQDRLYSFPLADFAGNLRSNDLVLLAPKELQALAQPDPPLAAR